MLVQVTFPLAAANFMNQAARMVMAIVGPVLAVELGLSAIELGVLAACLFAAYAAAQLPLGVALDAFGARRVQAVLMLLAAIGFAMFALSPGFAGLAAARIVLGIGISAGLMALIKAHADWFERGRVAYVTGIATAIGALGSALTTSPVQAMLPAFGWRGVFWVLCGLALGVATWIFLSVPDKPRVPGPARTLRGDIALSGRILASRTFWRFGPAVATLSMFNFAYLGLWAGPWLRDVAGMDGPARAGVLFLYTFAMVAGSVLTGSAASRANAAGLPSFLVPIVCLVGLVLLQAGLGVATLMLRVPLSLAVLHQLTAALTLVVFHRLSGRGWGETLIIRRTDIVALVAALRAIFGRLTGRRHGPFGLRGGESAADIVIGEREPGEER